jgi:hypothetical protein
VAFITAPTSGPTAATLPARTFAATSGLAAMAASAAVVSASLSETTFRPRSATTSSTLPPVWSTPSTACRASAAESDPSATSAMTLATCSGGMPRSAGSTCRTLDSWRR